MNRLHGNGKSAPVGEVGEDATKVRSAKLTMALDAGAPAEREALLLIRHMVDSEGFEHRHVIKHLFLLGVRAYISVNGRPTAEDAPQPAPAQSQSDLGKHRAPRAAGPSGPARIPAETAPAPPPALPAAPRPNFAGIMGDAK